LKRGHRVELLDQVKARLPSSATKLFRILSSFLADCDARDITSIRLPKPRAVVDNPAANPHAGR
jgi:hypothetical protein